MDKNRLMQSSGLSAGLAAALCFALSDMIFVALGWSREETLVWGAWLSSLTFGVAWAAIYFGSLLGNRAHGTVSGRPDAPTNAR